MAIAPDFGWQGRAMWSGRGRRVRTHSDCDSLRGKAPTLVASTTSSLRSEITGQPVSSSELWGANGNVLDIARSGNTLYIAGSFRSVGENSGGFVSVDATTGDAIRPFPKVAGAVYAIVPDDSGGWYVGGEFTAVGGKPRSCLAQIRADGSVSEWNPSVTGSPGYVDPPAVSVIAVDGNRVFVGGGFREIGGQPHQNFGCVNARTGAALDWNLDTSVDGWVHALAIHDSTVFVGGGLGSIGGQPRGSLAAVNATSGDVLPWRVDVFGGAYALLAHGETLYVGGDFIGIAGQAREILAAVDIGRAQLLPFDARVSGIKLDYVPLPQVTALALVGDTLYAGGNFTRIGGKIRSSIAALNSTSGTALAWTPDTLGPRHAGFPPPLIEALAVSGGTVYVGGWFDTAGGESRPFVSALDREAGAVTTWNPRPDLAVYVLAVKGDTIYVGGEFSFVGEWKHRAGLAAIDLTTGNVKPWNPNPNGGICTAVAVRGDRVFASGDFSVIGGQPTPRDHFAALDTTNGEVTDWNPGANGVATVFLLQGDTLFAGGEFTQVGGLGRNSLAAINTSTGEVLPWNPDANLPVYALARSGITMYVGGIFDHLKGVTRRGIAAVDAATGALTPWNPETDNGSVKALLVNGNTVYVGGMFGEIGGQPRRSIAALDATSGNATSWYPQPTSWGSPTEIKALALVDGSLCVGGVFGSIGGQPRICLAAVDTSTGLATDWDPGTDGFVWSLASQGNTVYAGGGFTRAGGLPAMGLVSFSFPSEPMPAPVPFALARSYPNPARSTSIIRFALPEEASVTLSVFDLQGRCVAKLLDHAFQAAGRHEVPVPMAGWQPGVYFTRLESGRRSAVSRFVVVE